MQTITINNNTYYLCTVVKKVSYPVAPDILDIEDNEKFKDVNGQSIEITIRGERKYDKCYFRVKDVSKGFKMPRLQETILDEKIDTITTTL